MDSRRNRVGAVAASIVLLVVALLGASLLPLNGAVPIAVSTGGPVQALATSGVNFDYVVIILMENHNICDIYTHCGGTGTYMTALADAYSIALQDNYCNVNPSLPNYLCLSGATDFGCSGYDGGPNSNPCTNSAWNSENIIDRILGAGLTWKAYMEDMPSNCYGDDSGNYAVRHDPFVYYNDIVSNSTRCNQVVPAGTAGSTLVADLASTSTASNYMWFTPDTCNDMHDCDVPIGDAYLSVLVPLILASNVFLTERAALLLTFDEGYGEPIYTVWAGPVVKTAYTSSTAYSHFSVLSTIESNWNLPPLTSNDQNAPNMNEFFTTPAGPDFSLSANPDTLSFVDGQSASSTISIKSTAGFNGAVSLSAASTPAGVTTSCVPASISGSQTSACTVSGTTPGSYTVVVTGTNGTLSHTASIAVTVTSAGPPTARFTFNPPSPKVNNSVDFDASSSTDPDPSATLQARWDWEGDGGWDTPLSSTLTVQHLFTTAGTYLVTLEILDSHALTDSTSQWVPVQNPGGGDTTPPQVAILSPSNDTVIASANITVTGVAWDDVAISTMELSTDNMTWTATSGTTSWSGTVRLKEGMNNIYARAIDTSGNVMTAVITVIADHSGQGVPSSFGPDPTLPILLGMSPVVALAAIHAFLWNRSRTPGSGVKKKAEIVRRPEKGTVDSQPPKES